MKKIHMFLTLFLLSGLLFSCQNEREVYGDVVSEDDASSSNRNVPLVTPQGISLESIVPGEIIVYVSESALSKMTISEVGNIQLNSVPTPMAKALASIKAKEIDRVFPPAGKYEARTRKEGLHRWLRIKFDESVDPTIAMSRLNQLNEIEHSEFNIIPTIMSKDGDFPFNDPYLKDQWHYHNTGELPGSVKGADINLFKAWEVTTGTPNVIVNVVDEGVNYTHIDLADSYYFNEAEINGTPGVDDDGNGYVDDKYGWNFANNSPNIIPGDHGTHVAGTIAARNNNAVGVCGVAGGNGAKDSGVRVISSCIFAGEKGSSEVATGAAIKYGADVGAVISQNSWGYPYSTGLTIIPEYVKAGIDYFIKYAGCDENGNQRPDSPMKGGVVIFAAGNDNVEFTSQPAEYSKVISVASYGPGLKKAYYSTHGDWVDICAPGGDLSYGDKAGVFSTVVAPEGMGNYGYMQGTSMACPHVSGVAALIVSKFGGPGFTADQLREQLLASVLPIDIDEINPNYKGKLGVGYIDAYQAVKNINEKKPPLKPQFKEDSEVDFTSITVKWEVPSDPDDGQAAFFKLYVSDKELTTSNYMEVGKPQGNARREINAVGKEAGDEMSFTLNRLLPNTTYYFALRAEDRWRLKSEVSFLKVTTKKNNPPVIKNIPSSDIALLDVVGSVEYEFEVDEIDGHEWTYKLSGQTKGISHTRTDKGFKITIRPVLDEGAYNFTAILTDELGGVSEYEIPFRVVSVKAPVVSAPVSSKVLGVSNDPVKFNLGNHFEKQEGFEITYTVNSSDKTVASATLEGKDQLVLKGLKNGRTFISVVATNGYKSTRITFEVLVTENSESDVYSVWPLPIRKDLNIWLNPKYSKVNVTLTTVKGEVVFDQEVTADESGMAKIDLKNLAPGSYKLKADAGHKPFEKSVLKK